MVQAQLSRTMYQSHWQAVLLSMASSPPPIMAPIAGMHESLPDSVGMQLDSGLNINTSGEDWKLDQYEFDPYIMSINNGDTRVKVEADQSAHNPENASQWQ